MSYYIDTLLSDIWNINNKLPSEHQYQMIQQVSMDMTTILLMCNDVLHLSLSPPVPVEQLIFYLESVHNKLTDLYNHTK
jgi:hypothetical protein